MGKFNKTSQDAFDNMQMDAGMLLNKFNPESPDVQDQDIICATTGGITASCVPTYSDQGADVDNCPDNTKELKKLEGWECKLSFTGLSVTPEAIKMALGAADISGKKITPRRDLKQEDFKDIWWVGDRMDGGMAAVKLINALSTGGLSLKTTKNGKGQLSVELMGHTSLKTQDTMPMEWYSAPASLPAKV